MAMKTSYNIGRIAGIDINIHITWLLVFGLLSWSLATGFFPQRYGFDAVTSWVLGIVAALLLFFSVIVHELSHSIVSKKHNMEVESITLFFFGGVANVAHEEMSAKAEFRMAIAGPLMSVVLAGVFFIIFKVQMLPAGTALFDYLYKINLILAAFNMIPGYPLDGGRVLRSALWAYYRDIKKATRIASRFGVFFGYFMMFIGFFSIFTGGFGIWYIFLGGFLVFLAKLGYQQVLLKEQLSTVDVSRLVSKCETIKPSQSLAEFVKWSEQSNLSCGLVKDKGSYYVIDLEQAVKIPRVAWSKAKVRDIMKRVRPISPKQDAFKLFIQIKKENVKLVPVVQKNRFLGVVREEDLTNMVKIRTMQEGVQA